MANRHAPNQKRKPGKNGDGDGDRPKQAKSRRKRAALGPAPHGHDNVTLPEGIKLFPYGMPSSSRSERKPASRDARKAARGGLILFGREVTVVHVLDLFVLFFKRPGWPPEDLVDIAFNTAIYYGLGKFTPQWPDHEMELSAWFFNILRVALWINAVWVTLIWFIKQLF